MGKTHNVKLFLRAWCPEHTWVMPIKWSFEESKGDGTTAGMKRFAMLRGQQPEGI